MKITKREYSNSKIKKNGNPMSKSNYIRIVVRDKYQFTSFRTQDVGKKGGILRIAGHRPSGSWSTQAWLISKKLVTNVNGKLKSTDEDVLNVLKQLGSTPKHIKKNLFKAKPRPNIAEKDKPTRAQLKAWRENIKKALLARWKK